MRRRQRPTEHGKILGINKNLTTVDVAVSCDHAIAQDFFVLHRKIGAAMGFEFIELDKTTRIEQSVDTLTRGEFALLVLFFDAIRAAALLGLSVEISQGLR